MKLSLNTWILAAWCLCLAAPPGIQALDPGKRITQYRHRQWFQQQGLPRNSVQDVVQTPDGYIWAATSDGLARFNGDSFTVFNSSNTPELAGNFVQSLVVRSNGSLWVGLDKNQGVAAYENGRFSNKISGDRLNGRSVISLCEDTEGSLWIGTRHNAFRFADGKIIEFSNDQNWYSSSTREIYRDKAGAMWLATENGVFCFRNGKFERFGRQEGLDCQDCNSICEDRTGMIWVGTQKGVSLLRDGHFINFPLRDKLNNNVTEVVHCDRDGNIWIGASWGLNRWNPQTGEIEYSPNPELFDNVMSLFEDREGNLWVGTDYGLHLLAESRFTFFDTTEGLRHSTLYTVLQDRRKRMWMGSRLGGACCLFNGEFTNYMEADGLSDNQVTAIAEDSQGALWFGTHFAGLNRYYKGVFTRHPVPSSDTSQYITALHENSMGGLWVGTASGLYELQNLQWTPVSLPGGNPPPFVRHIEETRDGSLWIATSRGLWRKHGMQWEVFSTGEGLPGNSVYHLFEDAQGIIWAGAEDGFAQFDDNGRWRQFPHSHGFKPQDIFWFSQDLYGDYWFYSSSGIFRIEKKTMLDFIHGENPVIRPQLFDIDDGLVSSECRWDGSPAGFRDRSGRLWFATVRGLAMVNPSDFRSNRTPPPVVIERVMVDGKDMPVHGDVRLPSGARRLEIKYAALSYKAPGKLLYKTRLEGLDDDWTSPSRDVNAVYLKLRPGTYRFRAAACNEDGVWNMEGASLAIAMPRQFYQTPWFWIPSSIFLALLVLSVHFYRLRRHQRREEELTRLVDERTRKLRENILERQKLEDQLAESRKMEAVGQLASGMAHHFNNILTVVLGHAALMGRDVQQHAGLSESVEAIKDSAERAAVLVQQLLAFGRMQFMKSRLVDLDELLIGLNAELRKTAGPAVKVNMSLAGKMPKVRLDKSQMSRVMLDLAANARDAMPDGGQFNLSVQLIALKKGDRHLPVDCLPGQFVCISASDTGRGMDKEALNHVFEPFFTTKDVGKGVGLSLSSAYGIVKQHGGWIVVESELGCGATFRIFFPVLPPEGESAVRSE